jgi:molecular chaperone HtpG
MEQYGFFRLKASVHLYTKKILLQQQAEDLLPDYLRFISGVVDSADLSLNISRETIQDNIVYRKLGKFLTRRILKFFSEQAVKDPTQYQTFWETFGRFIKEGMGSDFEHQKDLKELLRYHSSKTADDELISLSQYVERSLPDQKAIYYLNGPSREDIEQGPYIESFRRNGIEILYLYDAIDDFIMTSLGEYDGRKLISADAADIELPEAREEQAGEKPPLSDQEMQNLISWMKDTLGDRVKEVRESKRSIDRPAIIVNPDPGMTTSMRRILKAAGRQVFDSGPQILEINSRHPVLTTVQKLREGNTDRAFLQSCVEQIFDIALIEAGLMDNQRDMINRSFSIMEKALESLEKK